MASVQLAGTAGCFSALEHGALLRPVLAAGWDLGADLYRAPDPGPRSREANAEPHRGGRTSQAVKAAGIALKGRLAEALRPAIN